MKKKLSSTVSIHTEGNQRIISLTPKGLWSRLIGSGFMMIWMSIWSMGCAGLLWQVYTEFSFVMVLFSVPFIAGWFFGAAMLAGLLFGSERWIVDGHTLEVIKTCLITMQHDRIPLKEIQKIVVQKTSEVEDGKQFDVELETTGKTIEIAKSLDIQTATEYVEVLLAEVPGLVDRPVERQDPFASIANDSPTEFGSRSVRPGTSRWDREVEFGGETMFVNKGRFEIGNILGLVFINAFWNGIVSVFLLAPFTEEIDSPDTVEWFVYIFMIPFVLVGLAMVFALIVAILEPFRSTRYAFNNREITRRITYFGIPFSKTWNLMGHTGVEIKDDRNSKKFVNNNRHLTDGTHYSLIFYYKDEKITKMRRLTLAEAEWISTLIEKDRSSYSISRVDESIK